MIEEPVKCRVSNYYPNNSWINGCVYYISKLDGENPVVVLHNEFADRHCYGEVVNLFDILELFKKHVPSSEDWFICKSAGFDYDTDIRNRNIRKYTKGLVYEILMRLCHHDVFDCFNKHDLIKNSWYGEINSFFRPYYTIHVCYKHYQCP